MLPKVIIHNAVSIDGRIDWFKPDIGLYYQIISRWGEDATLCGSDTLLIGKEKIPAEKESDFEDIKISPDDPRPFLIVPDSKGRIRTWHHWKKIPYWKKCIVLCSKTTPKDYLKYLEERYIEYIICGKDKVNYSQALEKLNKKYKIKTVRVDSGGTLNGILLRAGLVDEVSVLIHPNLVGGISPKSLYRAPDLTSSKKVLKTKLIHLEKMKNNIIWIIYKIIY